MSGAGENGVKRLVLVILIDALGYDVVRRHGFLEQLCRPPRRVRTVFGYSSSAIPSLLTGAWPRDHGHFAMYARDPRRSPFRRDRWLIKLFGEWLNRPWFMKRRLHPRLVRRGITGYFSLYEIPPRLLPEWNLCQRRNLFQPGAIAGFPTMIDDLAARGIPHRIWDWSVPEERGLEELRAAVRRGRDAFLLHYSSALDGIMHAHGTGAPETAGKLEATEAYLTGLVREAHNKYDEVRLFVFGDHGMTDVEGAHDLWSRLPAVGPPRNRGVLYFLDSTMARFWFDDPARRGEVEAILAGEECGRIMPVEEERELGIYFPDRRYGELIFLMHPGQIIVPSFMGRAPVAGMHGYHPDHRGSDTTLLTNTKVEHPHDIRGLARLLRREVSRLAEAPV
ncbi:MAG: hypothetical protein GF355_13025 [Candidatus Eisenbacteria bacterium]|nr:hypothetical protein [Candidatus Eisenbacteria bacterium]